MLSGTLGDDDRYVLLLSDVTAAGAYVLVLQGRVASKEPGQTCHLKGLTRMFIPL